MTKIRDFKDFVSNLPAINGFSTINHKLRVDLRLNCSEYVIIDYIHNRNVAGKDTTIEDCRIKTGFSEQEQKYVLGALVQKGFIMPPGEEDTHFVLTDKWTKALSTLDKEFERSFWIMYDHEKKQSVTAWPGSKSQAKKNYVTVRKSYTFEYLMQQRDLYFEYLKECRLAGFDRQKMMASVFLGPQERFKEDWEAQLKDRIDARLKREGTEAPKPAAKAVTMQEVKQLYEKDPIK
jgi:hypothetical protein